MRFTTTVFALAAFASSALAHMEMEDPAPFRSKANKKIDSSTVDFDMNAPLSASGENFPCKGYQTDFSESPAGDPTATWPAGSKQKVTLTDSAAHNGGSCQLSLSFDGGKTFRVLKSIQGGCVRPEGGEHSFDFNVPAETKSGKAIFAWTWFNHTGNREMYMNCAAVDITGSGTSQLDDRPEIFKANIDNGCTVPEGTDVEFPEPGPDVEVISQANLGPPTGNCGSSSSPSPSPSPSSPPADENPANPTKSADPESTSSADPSKPTDSTKPKPTDSTKPKPTDPELKPANPTDSAEPTDEPTEKPTGSTKPKPTETPADSTNSEKSTDSPAPTNAKPAPTNATSTSDAPESTATANPPSSGVGTAYTVKPGDVCTNIASQQGVPITSIFQLNPSVNKDCTNLKPGQVLNLRRRSRIMRDLN